MADLEFIIVLTEHRFIGNVFQPFFIQKKEKFYSVAGMVKPHDLTGTEYQFQPYEKELVQIIEKYSDERLTKRFSRAGSVSEFYSTLKTDYFEKHIAPFIEKCMFQVVEILKQSPVRLFKKEVKYSNLYDEDVLTVVPSLARPQYNFERTESQTRYRLKVFIEGEEIELQGGGVKIVTQNPCLIIFRNQLAAFKKLKAKKLQPFFTKEFVAVPNTIEEKYYSGFVLNTIRDFDTTAIGFDILSGAIEKFALLSLENNLSYEPALVLGFTYGGETFLSSSNRKVAVLSERKNGRFVFRKIEREIEWEKEIQHFLESIGLIENAGYYSVKGMELLERENALYFLINWLNVNTPRLTEKGIRLTQKKFEKAFFTGTQNLEISVKGTNDWFDLYIIVQFGEFKIPFIKLKNYILNDIREFELPNGEIVVLPEEWFARYKGLFPFATLKGDCLRVQKIHFTLLKESVRFADKSALEQLQKFENIEKTKEHLPANLNARLRGYQKEGFRWMYQLHKIGFGACLADDMGLGKTLQTLALLLKLKRMEQPVRAADPESVYGQLDLFANTIEETSQPASLVVMPTSLVHNWGNEIQKFTPSLKIYKHIGSQRKEAVDLQKAARDYDIILTTYGTVRNDCDLLAETEFFYLILDESQFVKNPASKTYKAVLKLKAQNRLVLTGTPIENSLSDLWAQMNFLVPGLLGNLAFFSRHFITPIEKYADEAQQEKLQAMIRPFILRRKKNEVASDLPLLMEQVRPCNMTEEQAKMYEHEKSIIRNAILGSIENEGLGKPGMIILQGLAKLRQLANHPALLEKDSNVESGKFQEIFRMLENLIAENHKVLIFSSFVKHLELIKEEIEKKNWSYSLLTGQTTNREYVISQFQNDAENRIFLISLKAGGVGLNLTEADYVFIIDPWWNPAAENQAVSRAHRIGQNKHVFVYRFITENSIEEKIQKLKERKSSLADKFINSNDPFKKVSREELLSLLG
ncbi:MAG: DEAD/DEAH box helicase [Prolixibacteraceae bacterium]|nr:DEAD/DEAH box helicase [Prolixibacteraceae bacterium]